MNKRLLCATALLFAQQATALPFFGNTDPFAAAITNNSYEDFMKAKIAQPDALDDETYCAQLLQQSKGIITKLNSGQESRALGIRLGSLSKAAFYLGSSCFTAAISGLLDLDNLTEDIIDAATLRDYTFTAVFSMVLAIPTVLGVKGLTNLKHSLKYQSVENKIKNQKLIQKELGA